MKRRWIAMAAAAAIIGLATGADAQKSQPPKSQPPISQPPISQPPISYAPVAAAIPKGPNDPSLGVFRERLIDLARKKDLAAIERLLTRDFFWERDFGGSYDKLRAPVVNLSIALSLDDEDGSGWKTLAALAQAEPGPHGKRGGVFCAPARPRYDDGAFAKLLETTNTEAYEWSYPPRDGGVVRAEPKGTAPPLAKLGPHFVYTDLAARSPGFDPEKDWTPVTTHDGKRGFVGPGALLTLIDPRLCYVRYRSRWYINGYSGGGD